MSGAANDEKWGADSARRGRHRRRGSPEPPVVRAVSESLALEYRRKAVEGGTRLLRAIDWVGVGVEIASGKEFVGNVGGGGFKDFTALGDVTNIASRLTGQAGPGEILMDAKTYEAVAALHPETERRELDLKGKSAPIEAFAMQIC